MNDEMKRYSQELRRLNDEYYHQQMTVDDYRALRKALFDNIEMEFVRNDDGDRGHETTPLDTSSSRTSNSEL